MNGDNLPTLNKHYRYADQILYRKLVTQCHNCTREQCKQHLDCEQFARLKAAELKELMGVGRKQE